MASQPHWLQRRYWRSILLEPTVSDGFWVRSTPKGTRALAIMSLPAPPTSAATTRTLTGFFLSDRMTVRISHTCGALAAACLGQNRSQSLYFSGLAMVAAVAVGWASCAKAPKPVATLINTASVTLRQEIIACSGGLGLPPAGPVCRNCGPDARNFAVAADHNHPLEGGRPIAHISARILPSQGFG